MKNLYTLLLLIWFSILGQAQNYQYGIVHVSGNIFKVVAIPDFNSADSNMDSGIVDVSDIGFTLMLPADLSEIQNVTSLLAGRTWNLNSYDAAFLTGQGLGDGTKDAFLLTMNPGQSIFSHVANAQIELVSFDVVNPPTTGELYFLENSDPIAQGAGNVLDSFFNVDIDGVGNGAGTLDYYGGNDPVLDSFDFQTLKVEEVNPIMINIYPNPASEYIYISTSHTIQYVKIFDILGKEVVYLTNNNTINVSKLKTGIYILKVMTDNGSITKKIIIE